MCRRPQTPRNVKQTHMFPVVHFPFSASTNFENYSRSHAGIACESMEKISHKKSNALVPKAEKDVEVL